MSINESVSPERQERTTSPRPVALVGAAVAVAGAGSVVVWLLTRDSANPGFLGPIFAGVLAFAAGAGVGAVVGIASVRAGWIVRRRMRLGGPLSAFLAPLIGGLVPIAAFGILSLPVSLLAALGITSVGLVGLGSVLAIILIKYSRE